MQMKAEEEAFKANMLARFAEQDRVEQMNAQVCVLMTVVGRQWRKERHKRQPVLTVVPFVQGVPVQK